MPNPWFRFYSETISDKKLRRIARDTDQPFPLIIGVWAAYLSYASESPERGKLLMSSKIPITLADMSADVNVSETFLVTLHETFQKHDMVTVTDGVIEIVNWDKRQFVESSTDRVQRWRNARKSRAGNVTETLQKRYTETPDTDTDTDTERGGEKPPAPPSGSLKAKRADQEVHPALQAWRNNHEGKYPTKDGNLWEVIINTVGDKPEDVKLWSDIQAAWIALSWKPYNASGMMDYFKRREIPGKARKNGQQPPQQPKRVLRSPLAD